MKLEILKNEFAKGIEVVARLAQKTINLPILSNILLVADKNQLELSSTNLELGLRFWALAKVDEPGKIALPASVLLGLAGALGGEKIILQSEGGCLNIKDENNNTKIIGQSADEYPNLPEVRTEFTVLENSAFAFALEKVVDFVAPTQIRPELSGVFINFAAKKVIFAASDSFRLAEKELVLATESKAQQTIILPQRSAKELLNILTKFAGETKVFLAENQIMFELRENGQTQPRARLVSQLIEGNYPKYQNIIPKETITQLKVKKDELLNKLRAASIFANRANEVVLSLDPDKKFAELAAQNNELGESKTVLQGQLSGQKVKISFNHRFLAEGTTKLKGPEINCAFSSAEGPAVLKSAQDESFLYVIMPIRQNG